MSLIFLKLICTLIVEIWFGIANVQTSLVCHYKIKNRMANSDDLDETARYELSSGSTLYAKVFRLVSRAERIKPGRFV